MKNQDLVTMFNVLSNLDKTELNNEKIKQLRKVRLLIKDKLDEYNEVRKEIFLRYGVETDDDIAKLMKDDPEKHSKCIKEVKQSDEEKTDVQTEKFLKEWEVLNISKNYNEFIVDILIELLSI